MKTVRKGEDTFVEFSDFNEVREVFEEAIKEIEEKEKLTPMDILNALCYWMLILAK